MEELKRVDVINQQAKYGCEAEFKLGTDQEIAAKVCLWEAGSGSLYQDLCSEMRPGQTISPAVPADLRPWK